MTSLLGQRRVLTSLAPGAAAFGHPGRASGSFTLQLCRRRGLLTTTWTDPGCLSTLPANLMVGLHEAGTPWLLALPLSALLLRSTVIYPWFQRPRREGQARFAMLQPLVDAKMAQAVQQRALLERMKPATRTGVWAKLLQRWRIARLRSGIERKLQKHFKVPVHKWTSGIVSILILMAVSEAVRRLCGLSQGLLSMLLGPVMRLFAADDTGAPAVVEEDLSTLQIQSDTFLGRRDDFAAFTWIQISLKTAGFAWCEDLTAPDQTMILPVIFSATFFASIWFNPGAPKPGNWYDTKDPTDVQKQVKPKRTFWQKVMLVLSAASIIPASTMPCALLCYFVSNMAISRLQTAWLIKRFPVVIPPMACGQRPVLLSHLDCNRAHGLKAKKRRSS